MMIDEISGDLLQWLRGFYFVAEQGNLQLAAIAMGREKATISRQIQCLEKELGVTLFDRSSGKMIITQEGRMLLEKANTLFECWKQIQDDFKRDETTFRGNISIATTQGVLHNILPPLVDRFRRIHPRVTFQIKGDSREMVYKKIESSEADFGIAFSEIGRRGLVCHDLYEARRVMIAPKNNPFFPGEAVPSLKEIADAPLIFNVYHDMHDLPLEERFAQDRLTPQVVLRLNNFLTVKKCVSQGMGVAILSEVAISQADRQEFDIYYVDQYFPARKYGILLKRGRCLSEMVKAFLRTIKPNLDLSAGPEPLGTPAVPLVEFLWRSLALSRS